MKEKKGLKGKVSKVEKGCKGKSRKWKMGISENLESGKGN